MRTGNPMFNKQFKILIHLLANNQHSRVKWPNSKKDKVTSQAYLRKEIRIYL